MKKITLGAFALVLGFSIFSAGQAHAAPASLSILYGSDLQVGSTGNGVSELQAFLGEQGYFTLPPGVALGMFGSITRASLIRYQAAHSVPATGYFGQLTRNAIQADLSTHCYLGTCMTVAR